MQKHVATYLIDHLAGSTAGVELAGHLVTLFRGTEAEATVAELRDDIEADRDALKALADGLDVDESPVRKVGAWFAEKAAELKLKFDDPDVDAFARFEALEALSLGIEGKRSLWTALSWGLDEEIIGDLDLEELIQRAESQRDVVEELRLQSAEVAFQQ